MRIIKKIEIHRFRSISNISIEADEITIFSGLNNSGKSNILRALNLFFNKESSFGQKYFWGKDYNKAFTGHTGGKRAVTITLHFIEQGDAALKAPFSISKTFEIDKQDPEMEYHSSDTKVQEGIKKKDGNITRQFTRFLNRIEYFYVPAVRDKEFVRSLFLHFEKLIEHDSGREFKNKMEELSSVLQTNSREISSDFENFIGLPTQANLSSKITDILGTVEINVKTGIKITRRTKKEGKSLEDVYVNLFSSGDGVLMSYLTYFLAHVCKKISNKTFVWGFEEPENSLEYSKVQRIAEDFNGAFKKNAQIFVTTHSPAFIKLKDKPGVKFFRVYIKPEDQKQISEIKTLDEIKSRQESLFGSGDTDTSEYKKLREELHFVEFAKEVEEAVERVKNEEQSMLKEKEKFEEKYNEVLKNYPQKIFICEDSEDEVINLWGKWLKLFDITGVKVMTSNGSTGNFVENGVRHQKILDSSYNPKIFRQIDRDGLTDDQISLVTDKIFKNESKSLKYVFKFLPVNEVENFAVLCSPKNFDDVFWSNNFESIKDEFQRTAEASCKKLVKNFDLDTEKEKLKKFRQDDGGYVSITQKMRDDALAGGKSKFFPGKGICKKIVNFKAIDILSNTKNDNLPDELKEYMIDVKSFFDSR